MITAGVWDDNWGGYGADADRDGIRTYTGSGASNFDGGAFSGCETADCDKTLADIAMYWYESDIRTDLVDEVPTTARDLALADESAFGSNSDVMHQHMSTFVVGFGIEGTIDGEPVDFTSSFDWGDPLTDEGKINDLRHTAYNGRGAYLDAGNPQELREALEAAFEEFATGIGTASAVSFNSQEISQGSLVFRAFYNVKENTGDLIAQEFDETGAITDTVWSAATQLDLIAYDDRQIMTYDPGNHVARPFRATLPSCPLTNAYTTEACLTADQYDALIEFYDGTELQQVTERVNYFRGDASNERPSGPFRERPDVAGRLGDIVNASPVFVGEPSQLRRTNPPFPQGDGIYTLFQEQYIDRQPLIYVSANDGMMHVFEADTGDEHFA
ncbi:MAG: PilC/PilY family type IV pilus protein, partial [Pseudohongiellaceae bacterium]